MSQLPIDFPLEQRLTFAEFIVDQNVEILDRCTSLVGAAGFQSLWLWGGRASGKTHLLQSVVRAAPVEASIYLPGRRLSAHLPDCLDGLGQLRLIAIDDVDELLGSVGIESALLDLFQELSASEAVLLLSGSASAAGCQFVLPDLASRFRAADHYQVRPLGDDGTRELLLARARQRGLYLTQTVLEYWLQRAPRRIDLLLEQLAVLDKEALARKQPVTMKLIRQTLDL